MVKVAVVSGALKRPICWSRNGRYLQRRGFDFGLFPVAGGLEDLPALFSSVPYGHLRVDWLLHSNAGMPLFSVLSRLYGSGTSARELSQLALQSGVTRLPDPVVWEGCLQKGVTLLAARADWHPLSVAMFLSRPPAIGWVKPPRVDLDIPPGQLPPIPDSQIWGSLKELCKIIASGPPAVEIFALCPLYWRPPLLQALSRLAQGDVDCLAGLISIFSNPRR